LAAIEDFADLSCGAVVNCLFLILSSIVFTVVIRSFGSIGLRRKSMA
tara:strand:- start:6323 stop:6463 length:141 start_codon:yes stop_codon:yes gene_type:complete